MEYLYHLTRTQEFGHGGDTAAYMVQLNCGSTTIAEDVCISFGYLKTVVKPWLYSWLQNLVYNLHHMCSKPRHNFSFEY